MTFRFASRRSFQVSALLLLLAASGWLAHAHGTPVQPGPAIAPSPPSRAARPRVEVAFVLDTTGSMSGLIEGAKQKIWSIANQLAGGQPRPEVRMALVGYRDRGDAYVTRAVALTDDIDAVYAALQGFVADGGGDGPESVNQALHEAVTRVAWSADPSVYRVIFLVGDAPPHLDYADDVPFAESVRLARQRGIVVNTVQCGADAATESVWRQIASAGGGRFAAIGQDGGMLALEAPMDGELAALSRELSGTLVPYGAADERAELEEKHARAASAAPEAAAARAGFLSKLGGKLNAGRTDLVDAIASGSKKLSDVAESELPEALRALPPAEREEFVARKSEDRARLQRRIDALSAERDAWVREESARRAADGSGDSFDAEVLGAVRDQAAAAGIVY